MERYLNMKVLIIGSGAREHCIANKVLKNSSVDQVYVAPGNGATASMERSENVALSSIDEIVSFAKDNAIDFTIVGNEALLVEGIVDEFAKHNLAIFGSDKAASMLEGSKAYSKDFMKKYGVKTASYETFTDISKAKDYVKTQSFPLVVKASGLALGKGVLICQSEAEALTAIDEIMGDKVFGDAGDEVVIEEYLTGFEASILSVCDCKTIVPFLSAKDHKKIGDGETGLNTGGMGTIAPNPYMTNEIMEAFNKEILKPTLEGIKQEGFDFCGFIFFGLMITDKGVYLLEYNMRLGDPETQVVLPMMKFDFLSLLLETVAGRLSSFDVKWKRGFAVCVVASAIGYPNDYPKGKPIENLDQISSTIYMAGVALDDSGKFVTNGGRVLSIVDFDATLEEAHEKVYASVAKLDTSVLYYRKDIGVK